MNNQIFERLKEMLGEIMPELDLSAVIEKSSLQNDLGIDSIEMMMIAITIEDEYGFKFDDEINFETVENICDYIEEKTK